MKEKVHEWMLTLHLRHLGSPEDNEETQLYRGTEFQARLHLEEVRSMFK